MNTKRVVWVLTELYYPEETSTGYILTQIAEGIAEESHVSVICSQPTYAQKGRIAPWSETRNGVEIKRCRGGKLDRQKLLFRALNVLAISFSIGIKALCNVRSKSVILVVTNPPLLPFVAAVVAFVKRARLVILVHDVYPDVLVASGLFSSSSAVIRMLATFHVWLYRFATRVIVIGRDMEQLVQNRMKRGVGSVVYIPNWARPFTGTGSACEKERILADLGLARSTFIVFYGGNMGRTHGIEDLIEAAAELQEISADILFICVGSGGKRKWLEDSVRTRALRNVVLKASTDYDSCLCACDLGLIAFVEGMSGVSVPSRMYNIMAAGKAILAVADRSSELARVVTSQHVGVLVAPSNPAGLAAAILRAANDREGTIEMGRRARELAERSYTKQTAIEGYKLLMRQLTKADFL